MSDKKKKSDFAKTGISVISFKIKKEITYEDLTKDLIKEVGNKINIKNDKGRESNN